MEVVTRSSPSQFSSIPLPGISTAAGFIFGLLSSQSTEVSNVSLSSSTNRVVLLVDHSLELDAKIGAIVDTAKRNNISIPTSIKYYESLLNYNIKKTPAIK